MGRFLRRSLTVALLVSSACTKEPPAVRSSETGAAAALSQPSVPPVAVAATVPPPPAEADAGMSKGWSIRFDSGGVATLRNHSSATRWVLHDELHQPSRLEVQDGSGRIVPAFDERSRMKFDTTVRQEMFVAVEGGGELPLFRLRIASSAAGNSGMEWGPFRYGDLPPGTYSVTLVYEARVEHYTGERREKRRMEGAVVGVERAGPIPLVLPLSAR